LAHSFFCNSIPVRLSLLQVGGNLKTQTDEAFSSSCMIGLGSMHGSSGASPARNTRSWTAPDHTDQRYPRQSWFARRHAPAYGIVLDPRGKIAWGRGDIDNDPIVVVLTETVSDGHLAGLRKDGISYIFAGERELDLALALEILNRELGIKRLEVNGGGVTNGAFLRAALVDEISLAIFPAIDGAKGAPCVFDSTEGDAVAPAPLRAMTFESSEVLEGGAVWLRYRLQNV
jgi:riboflavin biosynthesis pyrimidine reductase